MSQTLEAAKPSTQLRPFIDLDPVAKDEVLRKWNDYSEDVTYFPGEYSITVDPAVPPVLHSQRSVPESHREPLKKELDLLVG